MLFDSFPILSIDFNLIPEKLRILPKLLDTSSGPSRHFKTQNIMMWISPCYLLHFHNCGKLRKLWMLGETYSGCCRHFKDLTYFLWDDIGTFMLFDSFRTLYIDFNLIPEKLRTLLKLSDTYSGPSRHFKTQKFMMWISPCYLLHFHNCVNLWKLWILGEMYSRCCRHFKDLEYSLWYNIVLSCYLTHFPLYPLILI